MVSLLAVVEQSEIINYARHFANKWFHVASVHVNKIWHEHLSCCQLSLIGQRLKACEGCFKSTPQSGDKFSAFSWILQSTVYPKSSNIHTEIWDFVASFGELRSQLIKSLNKPTFVDNKDFPYVILFLWTAKLNYNNLLLQLTCAVALLTRYTNTIKCLRAITKLITQNVQAVVRIIFPFKYHFYGAFLRQVFSVTTRESILFFLNCKLTIDFRFLNTRTYRELTNKQQMTDWLFKFNLCRTNLLKF